MKRLALIVPLMMLAACELLVDIDMPNTPPQMVVNILAQTDSTWLADISVSENSLADLSFFDSVTNAHVVITDETAGQSIILHHTKSGRYRANSFPVPGHTYSIEVQAAGFETVRASTAAPALTVITHAKIDSTRRVRYRDDDGEFDALPAEVTFVDPAGVKNTYQTGLFKYVVVQYPDPKNPNLMVIDSVKAFNSTYINDPGLVIKRDFFSTDQFPNRFGDESFDGTEKALTILVRDFSFSWVGTYGVGIRIACENEDYARYTDGRNLQREAELNPFAQPAPVYSNFSNGYGIFGVRTYTVVEWRKN